MTSEARQAAVSAYFRALALLDQARLQLWDKAGLTVTQLRLLFFLNECEGIGNAELADKLMVTRPSISALLERLERGEFIRREISPDDRRGICIWLEPRGRQAVAQMTAELRTYATSLLEMLSDAEVDDLTRSLSRLVESGRVVRARELEAETETATV
jgi:DNA-binding MarR family transcriptional regulator